VWLSVDADPMIAVDVTTCKHDSTVESPPMIEIVDPKPEWPTEFARLADVLRTGLGPLALRVDHIGSTAVPGLPAKDVIDLQVGVVELSAAVADAISRLGFVPFPQADRDHVPPGQSPSAHTARVNGWEKFLFTEPSGDRRANVHVRRVDAPNFRFALLFRDYLVAHPSSAAAYAELKRRLAAGLADAASYPTAKDPAVDLVYFAAEAWAAAVGWEPAENGAR